MRQAILSCLGGFSLVFAIAAVAATGCSVTTIAASSPDGDAAADNDAGDQTGMDGGTADAPTTRQTKVGDACGTCSKGQSCIGLSATGAGICLADCVAGACKGSETCNAGACSPTCDEGCPSLMECISDLNACVFDCEANPQLCGKGQMCSMGIECVTAVPDAGPLTCMPGGGTATSGVTGTKTVGSLTTTEQATFCDWAAAVTGGYDCAASCDGGITTHFATSQATCISEFTRPGCAATVTEVEGCVKDNATDVCALKVLTSPSCATLRACP